MRFSVDLPTDPDSIPKARRAVERVAGTVDELTLLNLRLLVSELVTNAVRHVPAGAAGRIELVVERVDGHVRIEVVDEGEGFLPTPRVDDQDKASGWGLHILAKVASRWGVESDDGARVWFEIDVPAPATG